MPLVLSAFPFRRIALAALVALAACTATTQRRVPFDLTPQMATLRQDTSTIASLLSRERLQDAIAPAERLTRFALPALEDESAIVHPDLVAAAEGFHAAALALHGALRANDAPRASESFDALVASCTACHRQFRADGVTALGLTAESR